jgi:hypothetical protein
MQTRNRLAAGMLLAVSVLVLGAALPASADEGMWLLNEFPAERFEQRYGFAPSQAWLDHVQAAAVRFNNGGSGSFVSADGLVITNHHVGFDCIQKVSSAEHDYVSDGFTAADRAGELACPDLELNVLASVERVTDRVKGAVEEGMDTTAAGDARRAAIAAIESECQEATGLRCDVITLYAGGEYDLYRYRRHTDVRLVWAPELQLANFGGDPDNFEYPRFNVDSAIFRVYEDGEPYHPPAFLPFDPSGPEDGEVTFLVGNPGSTGRLSTMAELYQLRDFIYPFYLQYLAHARTALLEYSARGEEQARIARDDVLGVENGLKAISGYMSGLLDEDLMAAKAADESALREAVAADPDLAARIGDPWSEMAKAQAEARTFFARSFALGINDGRLAGYAWIIVRLAAERQLPDAERLGRYREPALPSLYQQIYSEAPVYPDYEELQLSRALRQLLYQLGPTHPLVVQVLGDASPEQLAKKVLAGTKLGDVEVRRRLVEGGAEAVAASQDPLIRLMSIVEPVARALTKRQRDEVSAVEEDAGARIAEAYFAVKGSDTYPDATFTPRISFGQVKGYEQGGHPVRWYTTFGGMFERAAKLGPEPPYDLPAGLVAAKDRVDLDTHLDFTSTHDIIGGNSGSPVIDRQGRFVGIVFDGNLEMLPNRFAYSMDKARSISVDVRAILEALTKIYPAQHVADELLAASGKDMETEGDMEMEDAAAE